MSESVNQFDDPALKAALRKACGRTCAPEKLTHHLRELAKRESVVERPRRMLISWMSSLVAAAVVLLAVGLGWLLTASPAQALSPALLTSLSKTHDNCCHADNHHVVDKPNDSFATIGTTLAAQLHQPVIAADIGRDWTFKGAALCGVGTDPAAHLVFDNVGRHVSVFSMPASCESGKDGTLYESADVKHPTAGFALNGALICVVGSSDAAPMPLSQIVQIRDHLRSVTPALPATAFRTKDHELLVSRLP